MSKGSGTTQNRGSKGFEYSNTPLTSENHLQVEEAAVKAIHSLDVKDFGKVKKLMTE